MVGFAFRYGEAHILGREFSGYRITRRVDLPSISVRVRGLGLAGAVS